MGAAKAYARRAPRPPVRSLELAQEILRLTELAVFQGGSARFDEVGFYRLDTGLDSLTFEGRAPSPTGKGGPVGLFTLGADRLATFRNRQSGRAVSVPVTHGGLLKIDGATHAEWTIAIHPAPPDCGEHLCLALYGYASARTR